MYLIKNKVKKVILNNEKQRQFYYSYTSGGLNRPDGFIGPSNFPFKITVFRPNRYISQMIKNSCNPFNSSNDVILR